MSEKIEEVTALTVKQVIKFLSQYPEEAQVCGLYDGRNPVTQVIGSFYDDYSCPIVVIAYRENTVVPRFDENHPKYRYEFRNNS